MNPNPYEPLSTSNDSPSERYRTLLAGISILAAIFSVFPLSYSVLALSVNYNANVKTGGPIPPYIFLMASLIVCCIAALVFSWFRWRSRRFFTAFATYVFVVAGLATGPFVVVMLKVTFFS